MTWKNERICHRVLCPLLGYWRVRVKKHKKRHGLKNKDRREYETVFGAFFESICPHVKLPASNDDEQVVATRKKKQKKVPNAPKRNMSAYFFYCQEIRPTIKVEHPSATFGETAKVRLD